MEKLCLYLTVGGERYAHYIPFFLYFLGRSYPEYYCFIQVQGNIPLSVMDDIDMVSPPRHIVSKDCFKEYPHHPDILKTLRWTTYNELFENFTYIYYGDVDLFLIRETPTLLEQHIDILKRFDICYSNTDKIDPPETRGNRMTGLHFVRAKEYFSKMRPVMEKYDAMLKDNSWVSAIYNDKLKKADNQHALWLMIKEAGLKMPEHSFFNYGGLHLGHSRHSGRWKHLLQTDLVHRFYFEAFKNDFIPDEIFNTLYDRTSDEVRNEFDVLIEEGVS